MTMPLVIGASQQKRSGRPFIIKVNYASGFTVTLPLYNAGGYNYNFIVDWGDGAVSQVISATDANRIHTYASGGTYTITMTGTLEGWNGKATGLKEYIIEVTQWGRTGFKTISMSECARLVSCYGKLTTSQTSFNNMFGGCTLMTYCDVSEWDTSLITSFGTNWGDGMFRSCTSLTSLNCSKWVINTTSNVSLGGLYFNCSSLTTVGDISNWDTKKVTSVRQMFQNVKFNNTDIGYIGNWNLSNCTEFSYMFQGEVTMTNPDFSGWTLNTTSNFNMSHMFWGCTGLTTITGIGSWNMSKVTYMDFMFAGDTSLVSLDLSGWNLNTGSTMYVNNMFSGCSKLTTIGDVSTWETAKFTNTTLMFGSCTSLTNACVNYMNSWDVSNVVNFGTHYGDSMFASCTSLTSIDLSNWRFSTTSNVSLTLFWNCSNLTSIGDVSLWNTGKVVTMRQIFQGTKITDTVLGYMNNWDVSSCLNFSWMCTNCKSLTSIDLSNWRFSTTSNIDMQVMFGGCSNLTSLIITGWNTSKVTNFQQFLDGCTSLTTCDVSVLSTASATNVSYMFRNCCSMTAINISGWDLSLVTAANMTQYMFYGCYGLTSLTLPASLSRVDNQFAVFTGTPAITVYNINRSTAPTVSGTPFGNYAKPLHVPASNIGYDVAPWTNTAIFSSIINDL